MHTANLTRDGKGMLRMWRVSSAHYFGRIGKALTTEGRGHLRKNH